MIKTSWNPDKWFNSYKILHSPTEKFYHLADQYVVWPIREY
jgi:hypothetical protein